MGAGMDQCDHGNAESKGGTVMRNLMRMVGNASRTGGRETRSMHSVVRKVSMLTAVVVALASFGTALAAAPTITFVSPSPSDGATLTTNAVALAFTYNRTPRQTRTLVCALAGPTSSSGACDTPVAFGPGSQSGKSYSSLANGSYTFSVALTLTDGATVTATRR